MQELLHHRLLVKDKDQRLRFRIQRWRVIIPFPNFSQQPPIPWIPNPPIPSAFGWQVLLSQLTRWTVHHLHFRRLTGCYRSMRDVRIPDDTVLTIHVYLNKPEEPWFAYFQRTVRQFVLLLSAGLWLGAVRYATSYAARSWSLFCQRTDSSVHNSPSTETTTLSRQSVLFRGSGISVLPTASEPKFFRGALRRSPGLHFEYPHGCGGLRCAPDPVMLATNGHVPSCLEDAV